MSIFDSLQSPNNAGAVFVNAFESGQAKRKERDVNGALSAWAMNPGDQQAFGVLGPDGKGASIT